MKRTIPLKRYFQLTLVLALLFSMNSLFAQEREITGMISDAETNEPLIGVNVSVKGTTVGAITDFEGHYAIKASSGQVLLFSYVGYQDQEVEITDQTVINVVLNLSTEELDEVVVVGYGTMRKSDVTGSIVSISDDDLKQVKSTNVIESIQGKAAGVDIVKTSGEAGSGFGITVRGERSLSGGNSPLYIVDGVQYGSGIDINPNDIASMEILKDVASTSIYGARGANGVVIITTKKGTEGMSKVTYSSYIGINEPLGRLPYSDRDYYIQYKTDLARIKDYNRTGVWDESLVLEDDAWEPFELEGLANGTDTDWFGELYSTGVVQNHFLSASGGGSGIAYNLSADYTDEKGMLQGDNFKRYVIKANIDAKVTDRLTVGTSTIISFKDRDRMSFPAKSTALMNPLAVPYDSLGILIDNPMPKSTTINPLYYFVNNRYTRNEQTTRVFSNIYADLKLFEGFNFKTNLNVDLSNYRSGFYIDGQAGTSVGMYISPSKSFTWTNIATYDKDFDVHHLQVTAVSELNAYNIERYMMEGDNPAILGSLWYGLPSLLVDDITDYDPTDLENLIFPYNESSMASFLGRVNYSVFGKYVFTASLRYDGTSRLSHEDNNNWDLFPAFSAAWNASEEDFMQSIDFISSLKVRLGYGISGNFAVPTYASVSMTNPSPLYYEFGVDEAAALGYRPVATGNVNLGWEKTAALNFGIDFGLLKNRISGNLEIYRARTTDLLQKVALPLHAAIPFIYDNVGETETKGVELMLHSVNVSSPGTGGFRWTSDLTFTANKEKIIALNEGILKDEINNWFVGYPIDVYFDYEKAGIWQLDETEEMELFNSLGADFEPGDIKIVDQDGDTIITEADRVILGTPRPAWYGSFTNRFEYGNFDMSIMIMARMGQMIADPIMNSFQNRDVYDEGGYQANYWTPVNPTNEQPRLDPSVSAVNYMPYNSSLRYTDGSWIKVRDITLGYTLPESVSSKLNVSSFRVYGSLKNYFVLYSPLYAKGRYDPEMAGGTSWPNAKSIIFGVTLEF